MKNTLLDNRNRDIVRQVRCGADGSGATTRQIVDGVCTMMRPRYSVSYDAAYRNVSLHLRGKARAGTRRQQEYAEIARRVAAIMQSNKTIGYGIALNRVLDEGTASQLYLSPSYALRLYYRTRHMSVKR